MSLKHDPDLDASAGTLYWLASSDRLGQTVGRKATLNEVVVWLREQGAVDYEAAAKALFLRDGNFSAKVWDALPRDAKSEWREMSRATIDAALEEGT